MLEFRNSYYFVNTIKGYLLVILSFIFTVCYLKLLNQELVTSESGRLNARPCFLKCAQVTKAQEQFLHFVSLVYMC